MLDVKCCVQIDDVLDEKCCVQIDDVLDVKCCVQIDDVLDEKKNEEKVRRMMGESVALNSFSGSSSAAPAALAAGSPVKMVANGDSFGSSVFQSSTTVRAAVSL